MSPMISPKELAPIDWEFQVERDGFITRYGTTTCAFWKQVILQPNRLLSNYPVKRISEQVYNVAQKLSTDLA